MRVGVYLGYQPKELGGGHTYLQSLTEGLINYKGKHDFYFFQYRESSLVSDKGGRLIYLDEPAEHQPAAELPPAQHSRSATARIQPCARGSRSPTRHWSARAEPAASRTAPEQP